MKNKHRANALNHIAFPVGLKFDSDPFHENILQIKADGFLRVYQDENRSDEEREKALNDYIALGWNKVFTEGVTV